jgi:hypothetical protein
MVFNRHFSLTYASPFKCGKRTTGISNLAFIPTIFRGGRGTQATQFMCSPPTACQKSMLTCMHNLQSPLAARFQINLPEILAMDYGKLHAADIHSPSSPMRRHCTPSKYFCWATPSQIMLLLPRRDLPDAL